MGASGASAPPASITSARASRIAWNASPTAIVPEAQLIALVELGPVKPNSIAMLQLAAPGNTASASAGSSPRGPAFRKPPTCASAKATPPSAEPISAPTRSQSSRAGASSASASANRALMTASCEKRSSRLARFASRWSWGRKSGISAAMRLRKGVGSKRVTARTAERRATRPAHSPSAAVPIGVTAPTPVMTTRRPFLTATPHRECGVRSAECGIEPPPCYSAFRIPHSALVRAASCTLHVSFDPREGARGDAVDEHGADHEPRRERADQRPRGAVPLVHDGHRHSPVHRGESPRDVHASCDTPHVAVADFPPAQVDGHLGDPPGGVAQGAERAPRGHLHDATPLPALEEPHPAIVGQDLWPPLHGRGRREHALEGGRDQDPVDGDHAATTRKPGRARATAPTPASRNRSLNSPTVYPRRSDRRASWRVWRRNPRPNDAIQAPAIARRERRRSARTTARRATRSKLAIHRTASSRGRWCSTWLAITTSTVPGPSGRAPPSASTAVRPAARASRAAAGIRSMPTRESAIPCRLAHVAAAQGMSPPPVPTSSKVHRSGPFPLPPSPVPAWKNGSSASTIARVPPNSRLRRAMSARCARTAAGTAG